MFITIAVIAYNEENTIKNILDDISRQDYDHNFMEVVLVDSASTDGTKAVMQKFADGRMHLYYGIHLHLLLAVKE